MIHLHDFNTRWWGAPVGLLRDAAFFALPASEQHELCAPFDWVEWQDAESQVSPHALHQAGFFWADAQIPFQVRCQVPDVLKDFADDIHMQPMRTVPAAEELQPFRHERFLALPGCDTERITRRFGMWMQQLQRTSPALSLEAVLGGEVQGWFLAEADGKGLVLTLAMLRRDSRLSGFQLYAAALSTYAKMGFRHGHAGFSVRNHEVMNIYARLGARFLPPRQCYLRLSPPSPA